MSSRRIVIVDGEPVPIIDRRLQRQRAWKAGAILAGLALRIVSWNVLQHDPWDERVFKSGLESVGGHQWWDDENDPSMALPSELQGRATLGGGQTVGKIAAFVTTKTRYENGTPFLGWDSAQGGKTATLVSDVLLSEISLGERLPIGTTALLFTDYDGDGNRSGISIEDLTFRTLDPEVAHMLPDGTFGCDHMPGEAEYRGCQTGSSADDGLFTQSVWDFIQTSAPGETVRVAKKLLDVVTEGTIRCGIDQQLIPQMNAVYESHGITERIDDADEFARTLFRALIRNEPAKAGVPVQRQVVEMSGDHWEPPRTVTEAFKDDIQTFFNKFELDDKLKDPAFCLNAQGAPAFNLDVALSIEQLAFGGLAIPPAGWDQANNRFSTDPQFSLDMSLFTDAAIFN